MAHKGMGTIDWIAFILVVVGGLNWGFAVFDFNLVTWILGEGSTLTNLVYGLVGISALYSIIRIAKH